MQFSLKTVLGVIAVAAVACAILFVLPNRLSYCALFFVTLVLPGGTLGLIVYGRGYARAFGIGCAASPIAWALGALVPLYLVGFMQDFEALAILGADDAKAPYIKGCFVVFHLLNGSCGLLAVGVRWWTLRADSPPKKPAALRAGVLTDKPYVVLHDRVRVPISDEASAIESAPAPGT